jgi:Spy/CpxP family protein refolding chaperone
LAAEHNHTKPSKYAGEESRKIKSLSASDIKELRNGGGWGLAKAAELNGVPGPSHLLEMKTEIPLTQEQVEATTSIYTQMKTSAIQQGEQLITLEQKLEHLFQSGSIDPKSLRVSLENIAKARMELRYTHLASHLQMQKILSAKQIVTYNVLRGYSKTAACVTSPKGHDPKIWRKHNNCQ